MEQSPTLIKQSLMWLTKYLVTSFWSLQGVHTATCVGQLTYFWGVADHIYGLTYNYTKSSYTLLLCTLILHAWSPDPNLVVPQEACFKEQLEDGLWRIKLAGTEESVD